MNSFLWVPILSILAVLTIRWFSNRRLAEKGTPIAVDDPLMLEAYAKARASLDTLRELVAASNEAAVKFPLPNAAREIEHVWGDVVSIDADRVSARIVTPLIEGPTPDAPVDVSLADVEDWQVTLEDGRIRGGFTTRAQIAIARREGYHIPRAILAQETHFIDP